MIHVNSFPITKHKTYGLTKANSWSTNKHDVRIHMGTFWTTENHLIHVLYNRITCPCNIYPLIAHFYIAKLGFAGVYLFFLILLQNIHCGYSCTHNVPTIHVLSKNKKNIKTFLLKIFIFLNFKNHCILHGHFRNVYCSYKIYLKYLFLHVLEVNIKNLTLTGIQVLALKLLYHQRTRMPRKSISHLHRARFHIPNYLWCKENQTLMSKITKSLDCEI